MWTFSQNAFTTESCCALLNKCFFFATNFKSYNQTISSLLMWSSDWLSYNTNGHKISWGLAEGNIVYCCYKNHPGHSQVIGQCCQEAPTTRSFAAWYFFVTLRCKRSSSVLWQNQLLIFFHLLLQKLWTTLDRLVRAHEERAMAKGGR